MSTPLAVRLQPFEHQHNRPAVTPLQHPVPLTRTQGQNVAGLPPHTRPERRNTNLRAVLVEQQMRHRRRIDYRASLARADDRRDPPVCADCGCELDLEPAPHSPRCKEAE